MASSSSSPQQNETHRGFFGIEPPGKRRKVSESSRLYDVFINHRGPDVKDTLATQLYDSMRGLGIRTFLDSKERELGDSFPSTIETAIRSAGVHIAIFSKRYAESAWCLAELVLMLQTQAKIIPVFYDVEPWELRHIEKGVYADAFTAYEKKSRYLEKLKDWKEALQSISFIAGEEFNRFSDCKIILSAVQKEVHRTKALHVAKYPVGLHKLVEDFERKCLHELVQDFENQCGLKEEDEGKAKIVGIFGMGGCGKTTLSKELFNRRKSSYTRASFLFDVREASARSQLPTLQVKLLKDLFDEDQPIFSSAEEGTSYLRDRLQRNRCLSFLIVLDDVDHAQQLEALLDIDMLQTYGNSLVIVTTRDVSVLITTGITVAYHLKGMDRNDGRELFCWHAFGQPHPASEYDELVDAFVDVCGGLPLSLQVLGSHVHGRTQNYWCLELNKVSKMLPRDIKQRLKISFDALDDEEKQIFMDVACFFVHKPKSVAIRVWEGSGWNAQHALQTLQDKCLVEVVIYCKSDWSLGRDWDWVTGDISVLKMHDHLRDLGREMANECPSKRRKVSGFHPHRLWLHSDLKTLELKGFKNILSQTKGRCFHSFFDKSTGFTITYFLGESDHSFETSNPLLWLQLEGYSSVLASIPSWIPLQNLQCLRIQNGNQQRLWHSQEQVPSQLKELEIVGENLLSKILISGNNYPSLEFLKLQGMNNLIEVDLTRVNTLNCLEVTNCKNLKRFSTSDLTNLVVFYIGQCPELEKLPLGSLSCLERIAIVQCKHLKSVLGASNLKELGKLEINDCPELVEFCLFKSCSEITDLRKLVDLNISQCPGLQELSLAHLSCVEKIRIQECIHLKSVSGISDLRKLVQLDISKCPVLQELSLAHLCCVERIRIQECNHLKTVSGISDLWKLVQLDISQCSVLQELSLAHLSCVEEIRINECTHLKSVSGLSDLRKLVQLDISQCPVLQELSLVHLSSVEKIRIQECSDLKSVSGLSDLRKLVQLDISQCRLLQELSLAHLSCVEKIRLQECTHLKSISGISDLRKLVQLDISQCPVLQELSLAHLSCVEKIRIQECTHLKSISGISNLWKLVQLDIFQCHVLQELSLAHLSCVQKLRIQECIHLKSVSGISDLTKLVQLHISQCPGLELELRIVGFNCLKTVTVDSSVKLKCFELDGCRNLKIISGILDLQKVVILNIRDCPELEDLPILQGPSCLERITIHGCGKLNHLGLYICSDLKTASGNFDRAGLRIYGFPELQEFPLFGWLTWFKTISFVKCTKLKDITLPITLSSLEFLELSSCAKLKTVAGISNLTKLAKLYIRDCPELDWLSNLSTLSPLKSITVDGCGKLKNITLPTGLLKLMVERCRKLQTVAGISDLTNLTELYIRDCPMLEGLSNLASLSCLKIIRVDGLRKMNNIRLPTGLANFTVQRCRQLQTVAVIGDLEKLAQLYIKDCPKLEELPWLAPLSCLKSITVDGCGKVKNITLPTGLIKLVLQRCEKLQTVTGICDLSMLTQLYIVDCPELEEFPSLARLSWPMNIKIKNCVKLRTQQVYMNCMH